MFRFRNTAIRKSPRKTQLAPLGRRSGFRRRLLAELLEERRLLTGWTQQDRVLAYVESPFPEADSEFSRSVAVSEDWMAVGAPQAESSSSDTGAVFIYRRDDGGTPLDKSDDRWLNHSRLTATDADSGDQFGYSVSISGQTLVVGAYLNDQRGPDAGAAYVFTTNGSNWFQQAKLTGEPAASDYFGRDVSISNDTIVVGSLLDDDGGSNAGAAYVFTRTGSAWSLQQKLLANDANSDDQFGVSVSVSGDSIVVGSRYDDDNGEDSGSAYVFTRTADTWSQQAKLTADDGAADDEFGFSVSISGDRAIIGNFGDDDDGNRSGSAYVFERSGNSWNQQQKLTSSDASAGAFFGGNVSISGDHIAIGSYGVDDVGIDSGAAYIFTLSGSTWVEQAKLSASDAAQGDSFGVAVAVSGEQVVVGSLFDDVEEGGQLFADAGSAYSFYLQSGRWSERGRVLAFTDPIGPQAGATFGSSVAIDGELMVVGAANEDGVYSNSGAAYVYRRKDAGTPLDPSDDYWIEEARLISDDPGNEDLFGFSVSISGETIVVGSPRDDDAGFNSGLAYVFVLNEDDWEQHAKLSASDASDGDFFGVSVSISGDMIVVGSQGSTDGSNPGSAYVYARTENVWEQQAKLFASDAASDALFGKSVSISNDTIVVGSHRDDEDGSDSGSAYVYTRTDDVWGQQAKLTAAATTYFGFSVSISGDAVAVGSYLDVVSGSSTGAAYVFTRSGDTWTQETKLTAMDGGSGDQFGYSVSILDDTIVIGSRRDDEGGLNTGSAYVYVRDGIVWNEQTKLTATDAARWDQFGSSVSISDDSIAIGSPLGKFGDSEVGSAYVFNDVPPVKATPVGDRPALRIATIGDRNIVYADDPATGLEPYAVDLVSGETTLLADIIPGAEGSFPSPLNYEASNIFVAETLGRAYLSTQDGIWATDGTTAGTYRLADSIGIIDGVESEGKLFYGGQSALWSTDGTVDGTAVVKDLSTFGRVFPQNLFEYDGQIYFGLRVGQSSELWRTDGTEAGTVQILDLDTSTAPHSFAILDEQLFFFADRSLWKVESASATPEEVYQFDIANQESPPRFNGGVAFDGKLFFSAFSGDAGWELWSSDGTAAGTGLFLDLDGSPDSSLQVLGIDGGDSTFSKTAQTANGFFFYANIIGDTGFEPWFSDGTVEGTRILVDSAPGEEGWTAEGDGEEFQDYYGESRHFIGVGPKVYFAARLENGAVGVWESDGTEAGTKPVADLEFAGERLTLQDSVIGFEGLRLSRNERNLVVLANHPSLGKRLFQLDDDRRITVDVSDESQIAYTTIKAFLEGDEMVVLGISGATTDELVREKLMEISGINIIGSSTSQWFDINIDGLTQQELLDGISIQAGEGTADNDLLILRGDTVVTNYQYTTGGPESGTIEADGITVYFSEFEPIEDRLNVQNREFTIGTPGSQNILLGNDVQEGFSLLDDGGTGAFESLSFRSPTRRFSIDAGDGDDAIVVAPLDASFAATLVVSGQGGNDSIDASQFDRPITISGGPGNDVLKGGLADDMIDAGEGQDLIEGGGGNDTIEDPDGDPIARDDQFTTSEDDVLVLSIEDGPLANDSDPSGGQLEIVAVVGGQVGEPVLLESGAQLTLMSSGALVFDPSSAYQSLPIGGTAVEIVSYTIENTTGSNSTAHVTFLIEGRNDAPIVSDLAFTTAENAGNIEWEPQYTDPDAGDSFSFQLETTGLFGSAIDKGNGRFAYAPNGAFDFLPAGQTAQDIFYYTVTDANGAQSTGEVQITIVGENDAAEISGALTESIDEDTQEAITGNLDVRDPDEGEDLFKAQVGVDGLYGTFSIDADGTWIYLVDAEAVQFLSGGQSLVDPFSVASADGTASETIAISIDGLNDPAVVTSLSSSSPNFQSISVDGNVIVRGSFEDLDASDSHDLQVNWGDGTSSMATIDAGERSFNAEHAYSHGGVFEVVLVLSDSGAESTTATTTAAVQGVGLVAETLWIIGTEQRDKVDLEQSWRYDGSGPWWKPENWFEVIEVDARLDHRRVRESFAKSDISFIEIVTLGGRDDVDVKRKVDKSLRIDAGEGDDRIDVHSGTATILAGPGDDSISTSEGTDNVDGGPGNDRIRTEGGDDTIIDLHGDNDIDTGAGADTVTTGPGNDRISTSLGDDTIADLGGHNRVDTGSGNDSVSLGDGNDRVDLGSGDDIAWLGGGDDRAEGDDGDDLIFGQAGNDRIEGGRGNDVIIGGDGNDRIEGDRGADLLIGGFGADRIDGGKDDDLLIAGWTSYDNDDVTLRRIFAEWTSEKDYLVKTDNLRTGAGPLAGVQLLAGTTVFNDESSDHLDGEGGHDWFFAAFADDLIRRRGDELLDLL